MGLLPFAAQPRIHNPVQRGPGRVRSVRFSTDGPPAPLEPCRGLRPIVTRDADGTERVVGYTADGSAD